MKKQKDNTKQHFRSFSFQAATFRSDCTTFSYSFLVCCFVHARRVVLFSDALLFYFLKSLLFSAISSISVQLSSLEISSFSTMPALIFLRRPHIQDHFCGACISCHACRFYFTLSTTFSTCESLLLRHLCHRRTFIPRLYVASTKSSSRSAAATIAFFCSCHGVLPLLSRNSISPNVGSDRRIFRFD